MLIFTKPIPSGSMCVLGKFCDHKSGYWDETDVCYTAEGTRQYSRGRLHPGTKTLWPPFPHVNSSSRESADDSPTDTDGMAIFCNTLIWLDPGHGGPETHTVNIGCFVSRSVHLKPFHQNYNQVF